MKVVTRHPTLREIKVSNQVKTEKYNKFFDFIFVVSVDFPGMRFRSSDSVANSYFLKGHMLFFTNLSLSLWDHSFSTCAKSSKNLTFLTP